VKLGGSTYTLPVKIQQVPRGEIIRGRPEDETEINVADALITSGSLIFGCADLYTGLLQAYRTKVGFGQEVTFMRIEELEHAAISGLYIAYEVHEELGSRGEERAQKNQFGETALLVDIKTEEAVINVLRTAHVPIELISEEHGIVEIGEAPRFLGVLDGLDGSSVYSLQRGKARYGTMLSIFSSLAPNYGDYLLCGVMIHSPKPELFFARKGGGSFVVMDGEWRAISCSGVMKLQETTKIYIDDYFEVNRELFAKRLAGFNIQSAHSSAVHYTDVARGAADAALECTRKRNLEIAVAYGLVTEAGGVMLTLDKTSLEHRHYRTFSQDKHTPIVTASTLELADDIIRYIAS